MNSKFIIALSAAAVVASAFAGGTEGNNRPRGFRLGSSNLTLLPYVNLAYTYDTNIDQIHKATRDNIVLITPGAALKYDNQNGFKIDSRIFYTHRWYLKYSGLNQDSYGEGIELEKNTSNKGEKGWSFGLREQYHKIGQDDDMTKSDGRGMWRDRETIDVNGTIQRRFTDRFHATLTAAYNRMDYDNDKKKYGKLYGWTRYTVGGQLGYGITENTDLLLAAGYSKYRHGKSSDTVRSFSNNSQGYSIMAGLGSRLDRQWTYRALVGASWFEYGNEYDTRGWTYQVSSKWQATDRMSVVLLGSSYYQPSETTAATATKVYTVSAGMNYLFTDHLKGSFDIAYRNDDRVYTNHIQKRGNRDEDYLCGRIRADWYFNRYASLYAAVEYEWIDYASPDNKNWSYDRFRGTLGLQLHY